MLLMLFSLIRDFMLAIDPTSMVSPMIFSEAQRINPQLKSSITKSQPYARIVPIPIKAYHSFQFLALPL